MYFSIGKVEFSVIFFTIVNMARIKNFWVEKTEKRVKIIFGSTKSVLRGKMVNNEVRKSMQLFFQK